MAAIDEVCSFLKEAGTYYLATVDGDQPRVRPFGTVNIFEGKLYIQTGKSKDVFKQLATNPKAEISAFKNGEWIRVSGSLIPDENDAAVEDMLNNYPDLKNMYAVGDGNAIVLYFKDGEATFASFTGAPRTVKF